MRRTRQTTGTRAITMRSGPRGRSRVRRAVGGRPRHAAAAPARLPASSARGPRRSGRLSSRSGGRAPLESPTSTRASDPEDAPRHRAERARGARPPLDRHARRRASRQPGAVSRGRPLDGPRPERVLGDRRDDRLHRHRDRDGRGPLPRLAAPRDRRPEQPLGRPAQPPPLAPGRPRRRHRLLLPSRRGRLVPCRPEAGPRPAAHVGPRARLRHRDRRQPHLRRSLDHLGALRAGGRRGRGPGLARTTSSAARARRASSSTSGGTRTTCTSASSTRARRSGAGSRTRSWSRPGSPRRRW